MFGRLNPTALKAIETATGFCKMRGNPYVELVHWLHILLQDPRNDIAAIRTAFGIDDAQLVARRGRRARRPAARRHRDLRFLAADRGSDREGLDVRLAAVLRRRVRTGHLLVRHAEDADACATPCSIDLAELRKINVETAVRRIRDHRRAVLGSRAGPADCRPAAATTGDGGVPVAAGEGEALAQFSIDLTEKARNGEIDTIVGRDAEIRQMIDILLRRRQNNPILTGEAGVGKTAVVEGFAQRIVDGDVPPSLQDVTLRALDIGLLQAGASVKGEFEKRLRQVIDEVEASPKPIILFIDEAHTLIGAGGAGGHRRCRQPAQARAGARRAAHHRAPPPGPNTASTSRRTRR